MTQGAIYWLEGALMFKHVMLALKLTGVSMSIQILYGRPLTGISVAFMGNLELK